MKSLLIFLLLFPAFTFAQSVQQLDHIRMPAGTDNVHNQKLYGDSLVSSFLLFIRKEVKLHKHLSHSEHVYILEDEGLMQLGEQQLKVKKGDMIFIPMNTPHAVKVTSAVPLKVISVQAPFFDGKDRVRLE